MLKASKRGEVAPFIAMDVFAKAKAMEAAGRSVIHLKLGQPSTGLPRAAADRLTGAMTKDPLGYTEARGTQDVREAIANHYDQRYGVSVDPASVMMTMGSSGGFLLAFLAAFDPGDRIALAVPAYPPYVQVIRSLGLIPVPVPVGPAERFQPTLEQIKALSPQPDGLLLASPANPTGTALSAERFDALMAYCAEAGIRPICDEVYHGLEYGDPCATAAGAPGGPIVINGFSKYFCMTGWRLGWMIMPDDLSQAIERLGQSLFISAPTPAQEAAVHVFGCTDELDENLRRYAANRAVLLDGLPRAGFGDIAPADGAFYLYADISGLAGDSLAFCDDVLETTGVSMTPGIDFDPDRGRSYVRISYAGAEADVTEGLARLTQWASAR